MAAVKKVETNIQMLTRLMTFSQHGALMQMFIIDALTKHSERVAKASPDDFKGGLVHPEAWIGVAKELKKELDAHFA